MAPYGKPESAAIFEAVSFDAIPGWSEDDHRAAFAAFLASARWLGRQNWSSSGTGVDNAALLDAARQACALGSLTADGARLFFESCFSPRRIAAPGFVTGYFEPEVVGSLTRSSRFAAPLYRRPPDLVEVRGEEQPGGAGKNVFGQQTLVGLVPHVTRAEADAGALAGQGLELVWLESAVDAFFIHVQGSARIRLPDGRLLRVGFDGKSGHPYSSIGRLAVERGLLPAKAADKDGLESWIRANPEAGAALMRANQSFIFFREVLGLDDTDGPIGAAGVALVPGRSLAVDQAFVPFHIPVWVDAAGVPDPEHGGSFRRLMVAQDAGSAIIGPGRGDLFFGSGAEAGSRAGRVRHGAEMITLDPDPGKVGAP